MSKLTLKNFFEKLYQSKVRDGRKLHETGGVIYTIKQSDDKYQALVQGSGQNYTVNIEFDYDEIIKKTCDCPDDWGDTCIHIAATLFELRKRVIRKPKRTNAKPTPTTQPTNKKSKKKTIPEEGQMEEYERLPQTEQQILKIAAVAGTPLSQTKFVETFNGCNFKHNRKNIYAKDIKPILYRFMDLGYLTRNRDNQYGCKTKFADDLCQQYFSKDADFDKIATVFKRTSQSRFYYWNDANYVFQLFRELRIARYKDEVGTFQRCYNTLIAHPRSSYSQSTLCEVWLPFSFDLTKIEALPISIRAFLLSEKLILNLFDLAKLDGYYFYTLDKINIFPKLHQADIASLLSYFMLFRGEWEALDKVIPYLSAEDLGGLTGIRQFMAGDAEEAVSTFDQTQKVWRKKTKNSKQYLGHIEGVFYVLARLKTQKEPQLKKADSHIKWSLKNPDSYANIFKWLKAVRLFLKNDKTGALQEMRYTKNQEDAVNFFKPFCQFWIDKDKVEIPLINNLLTKVEENGYQWLAVELLALKNQIKPIEPKKLTLLNNHIQTLKIEPIYKVVPRVEDWELALNALLKLGDNSTTTAQSDSRLVWLVDFDYLHIQARSQSYGKGGWTKGRVVSYDRLRKKEVDNITPHDERIIGAVGYAYSSEISINDENILKQLVGHPLLFLAKSPQIGVQLVLGKPKLIARKEETGGFRLTFSHDIKEAGCKIIKESPTKYLLLEITEKMAQIAKSFSGKALNVPKEGADTLKEAITGLSNVIQVESAFEEENLPKIEADSRACVHLLPVGDGFHVEIYAKPFGDFPPYVKIGKGEVTLISLIDGVRTATSRDLKLEKSNFKELKTLVPILQEVEPQMGVWELEDTDHCLQFLLQLSPLVENKTIILEWPKGEKFRITQIAGMDQFRMEINEKNNWFEVNGSLPVDEEKVLTMKELLALSQQQGQFVEISPGKFLAITKEFKEKLARINGLVNAQKNGSIQLHPLAAPAIQEFTDALKNLQTDAKFKQNQEKLEKAFTQKNRVSKHFKATLRPYQKEGYQWLHRCAAWGVGACLADDMGLGKTIQALALLVDRAKLGPALVVAPASVCRNWVKETQKFAPTLRPLLFGEGDRAAMIKKAGKKDLIIVTYDLLTREAVKFKEKEFATIILDEAQAIKNRATKRSETAMELQGAFKIIMTGTPVENHLGELWNLFQFANPGLLGSLDNFAQRFAIPIEKNKDENRRDQLRRLLQPFILRRKKGEVLKDLPEKTEITLSAALSTEERAFYEALRRNALEKLTNDEGHGGQRHLKILAEIMRLRRAACHPKLVDKNASFIGSAKLDLFEEIVADLLASGHKALVFSQFVGHLKLLENHLKEQNISYQYLDGQTPLAKRQMRIDAFQNGVGDIFLISLKAGGTGLNLTAADYVIHMDPWWNPAVEDQATDRAHRIGQERPVTVYRLVAEGTIEEKILQLHEKKRDLADSLLAGTDVSAKLTAKDLLNLIADK